MSFQRANFPRSRPGLSVLILVTAAVAVPAVLVTAGRAPAAGPAPASSASTSSALASSAPASSALASSAPAGPARAAAPAAITATPTRSPASASAAGPGRDRAVTVQVLAINDLHGHLEDGQKRISARTGSSGGPGHVPAGGAVHLAAAIGAARRANPATLVVSAGDLVGGSPMISGYYHDEPTVEVANQLLDVGVVGNHEFDEGTAELRRLVRGGCHPQDGCQDGTGFRGTTFDLLAANVVDRRTGRPILPAYTIKEVGGARIGFIGTVTPDTPTLVNRRGIRDVAFLDQAATVRRLVPQVRAAGADAVVLLTHSGASQAEGGINDCRGVAGEAVDLTRAVAGQVDAVLSAHTHASYVCLIEGTQFSSAASYGRVMTTLTLTVDTAAHRVTAKRARNSVVRHQDTAPAAVARIVRRYQRLIAPVANRTVGRLSRTANRNPTRSGESVLANIVGDAQLAATAPRRRGGAQLALVVHGLNRTNLEKGRITYGEVYAAQPFGHRLVTLTLTGRQIDRVLETQFCNPAAVHPERLVPLGTSRSFTYRYDPDARCGHKVRIRDFRLEGARMTADGRYRVTINELFAAGESGFEVLTGGTDRVTGVLERDALAAYLTAHPDLDLPRRNRILLR